MEIENKNAAPGIWPALVLFLLAPTIGELLSGSAPPAEFFQPTTFLLLAVLYGSGAILIRELRVRWKKDWSTVFVLGGAYAIVEEGLMVKSFFDPEWMDLGILGEYGRWAGVNWVWAFQLITYHSIFSIAIPILLVELLFPAQRDQSWVESRGMIILAIMLCADVIFGAWFLTSYRPPSFLYLLAFLNVVGLCWVAKRMPSRIREFQSITQSPSKPGWFVLLGFVATLLFIFITMICPYLEVPVAFTLLAVPTLAALTTWFVMKMSANGTWGDEHRLALASGALTFWCTLGLLQELDKTRPDNASGMSLVGLLTFIFLALLWRRVHRSSRKNLGD